MLNLYSFQLTSHREQKDCTCRCTRREVDIRTPGEDALDSARRPGFGWVGMGGGTEDCVRGIDGISVSVQRGQ